VFGGTIRTAAAGGDAIEIWSCSLSLLQADPVDPAAVASVTGAAVQQWFVSPGANIHPSVRLEWIKNNEFNEVTGIQVTDPTIEYAYPVDYRGGGSSTVTHPIPTSYRISIDSSLRNASTRGGFFVPRAAAPIGSNGRFSTESMTAMTDAAELLLQSINAGVGMEIGVWSRKDGIVYTANRVRVGDVPDNISSRRNDLPENYLARDLSP
jgi:hypothetical protein